MATLVACTLGIASANSLARAATYAVLDFRPTCMSVDGRIVYGSRSDPHCTTSPCDLQICRWSRGVGTQVLSTGYSGAPSSVQACSGDGSVFVGFWSDPVAGRLWYRYQSNQFQPMEPAGHIGTSTVDLAVSVNGSVVYGSTTNGLDVFRWTASTGTQLLPRATATQVGLKVGDASADGTTVVVRGKPDGATGWERTMRYSAAAGWQIMPDRPTPTVNVNGADVQCSSDGSRVVGESWGHGAIWSQVAAPQDLGLPAGVDYAFAVGTSDDSRIVTLNTGRFLGALPVYAFLWTPTGGLRNLRDALAQDYGLLLPEPLSSAGEVSDDGSTLIAFGNSGTAYLVFLTSPCPADLDNDGDFANGGMQDAAVTIEDLLFFLAGFELGDTRVDLDNGTGTGVRDEAVTIDDLLFFLDHFEAGC